VRVKKKIIYELDDCQTLQQNSGLKAERNIGDPHVFQVPLPRKELTDGLQGPMLNEEVLFATQAAYNHYNDNEHAKTDMYIEHYINTQN